jgi:hypothetical protein
MIIRDNILVPIDSGEQLHSTNGIMCMYKYVSTWRCGTSPRWNGCQNLFRVFVNYRMSIHQFTPIPVCYALFHDIYP